MKHITPTLKLSSFHCPHCEVMAVQTWSYDISCRYQFNQADGRLVTTAYQLKNTFIAKCAHCQEVSIWINQKMTYPLTGNIEAANPDLPENIKYDYNEAKNIFNISPRGSAALLRLALQKLCIHLGEKGKNINDDIENLVKKGLPKSMQQALDSVRVIGNNAVHPGVIDLNDKVEIAYALFGFINVICEVLISQPKKIQEYYDTNIPENIRQVINERDKK
ncbi:DUF4145 domain-containing protein [Flavobacterium sp. ST-75]|uniref:DUF4145 domain-containing protein n=1 Tax=Flavobacterium rhizophilum TaxID=3163296 RepID=A0ABW8YC45_9FLAO